MQPDSFSRRQYRATYLNSEGDMIAFESALARNIGQATAFARQRRPQGAHKIALRFDGGEFTIDANVRESGTC